MIFQYQWGESYGTFNQKAVDAQTVGERIEKLREQKGPGITAKDVVDDARPVRSPTHNLFEWDNTAAAEQWRLYQGRHVINAVRIVVDDGADELPKTIVANVSIAEGPERSYRSTYEVASNDDLQAWILQNAFNYLAGFKQRYEHLQLLKPIFDAIEQVQKEVKPEPAPRRRRRPGTLRAAR